MKVIQIIFILLTIFSCNRQVTNSLNSGIKIIVKYQTLDENISPDHIKCSDEIRAFDKMNEYDCSFRLGNDEYDIEKKFILDERSILKEYWVYKSEGPLIYQIAELKSDSDFLKSIGNTKWYVDILGNGRQIVCNGDTLTIERVFSKERLILIKQGESIKKTRRRMFFEYKSS